MPELPLTALLQSVLPSLSGSGRAIVSALGCFNGAAGSAQRVAVLCGMHSRYQLARALRREGLPLFDVLVAWTRVLRWLLEAERTGKPLMQLARRDRVSPAVAYRLVHRTTSLRWSEVRKAGLGVMVDRLAGEWRRPSTSASLGGRARQRLFAPPSPARVSRSVLPTGDPGPPGLAEWARVTPPSSTATHPAGRLAHRVPAPDYPFDVAIASNGTAWVTRVHAAAIAGIRLDPPRVMSSIHTGAVPTRIALAPRGTLAYVTNQFAEQVGVLDLRAGRQVGAIPIRGNPLGAVLSQDARILYVTTNLDYLHAISTSTGQVVATVPIPMACTSLLLHPAGTRLFVPAFRAGVILELDARTLKTGRQFAVGGVVHELACTRDGRYLFASNEDGWLDAVHLPTGQRASRHFESMAHGLALSPDEAVLYVGLLHAGAVAVVERATLAIRATIPAGGKPRRIAFGAAGRTALITNECGWIDVIE